MYRKTMVLALALAAVAGDASAQEYQTTRRSYTFMDNRLKVTVAAEAAGELHVIRGERGRVEVAARSDDGFPGFGLAGSPYRELTLTAPGAGRVQYLLVVPGRVSVSVQLPGERASRSVSGDGGVFRWGDDGAAGLEDAGPILPTTSTGLYVALVRTWAPRVVDVTDLTSVRSLSVRVEGGEFRVAASRPLSVAAGDRSRLEVSVAGEPIDVVLYLPEGSTGVEVRSGDQRLAQVTAGRLRSSCSGAVIQAPTPHQRWLTIWPEAGQVACR
jgi:hypothetical protein